MKSCAVGLMVLLFAACGVLWGSHVEGIDALDPATDAHTKPADGDWLITPMKSQARVFRSADGRQVIMSNGLISRCLLVAPNAATVAVDNLMTGESMLRGVKPEALVAIDGQTFEVGGLTGQPNYAYLLDEWLDDLQATPRAFQLAKVRTGRIEKRFDWKRKRYSADLPWPAPGVTLSMDYRLTAEAIHDTDSKLLASTEGRSLLLSEDFERLGGHWTVHQTRHERSSFANEGKTGEIYTPANTCVYAERKLPEGVRLVQCFVDTGTDRSASWGPGIAVVFEHRVIKFYLRPGKDEFGIYDGGGERTAGKVEPGKAYWLRLRIEAAAVHCEASVDGDKWFSVHVVQTGAALGKPKAVRIGKTSYTGQANDFSEPGEYVRCRVGAFRAYSQIRTEAIQRLNAARAYLKDITVSVHYELYDHLPLMTKWISLRNDSDRSIVLDTFTSEILAMVEGSSSVESVKGYVLPNMHVECDYEFLGMSSADANVCVNWVADPQYLTQVNYLYQTPCLLECRPPIGPAAAIAPGQSFESFRTYMLIHDSTDRERQGLAQRRMYRTVAPWVTENPIMMHVRSARPDAVRLAIDQCAEVGFEMVILTFGSGFNMENEDPAYLAQIKDLVDYAHGKGIELGGYSLLASRRISDEHDVVNPETGRPGGFAAFGNSPCLGSVWGRNYFRKLYAFFEKTGFDLLEHDGSYPGDVCASTTHPGHTGLADSQYTQWKTITDFYKWCRGRGIYLNVPDYYYLNGTNKSGMGYRETNWSLPRAQQIIHARQNIYDGTWQKTPSMGWMFVPLTEYHGGGAAATIEPLSEHLDAYEAHLANNFGLGVQACYRGPRLYDTEETKAVVKKWVDFYKRHRPILDSDLIHVRRADGREIDCMMHVNPNLKEKGLAMVYNPTGQRVRKNLKLNLYYTGLTDSAMIREKDGKPRRYTLDRDYSVSVPLDVPASGVTWLIIE